MGKAIYTPVLILRDEEIKRLPTLKDAFSHSEVIPFLEVIRDFMNPAIRPGRTKKDGTLGKSSEKDSRLMVNILLELPKDKTVFVAVYRNLDKCSSSDFSKEYPYLASLLDVKAYFSESIKLFSFKNVIPVFEVDNHDDLSLALDFVRKGHGLGRSVGLRVNVIDSETSAVASELSKDDFLFLNIGEEEVSTVLPSLNFYNDLHIGTPLIIIGENHPANVKTKDLTAAANETVKLHADYFDDIKQYPYIGGAGDYCGVKNVLKQESIRSKKPHPGQANFIIYHHATKGYQVIVDGRANGVPGYWNVYRQALAASKQIDPHALAIIQTEKTVGAYARWNVIGAVHYVYDVLQIVV